MRHTTIDTRDLIERRDELKQQVIDAFNEEFEEEIDKGEIEEVEYYEDIDFTIEVFKELWDDEITEIEDIDILEEEVGSEFQHGEVLIHEDYFEEYTQDLLEDCGYIPRDLPSWIKIDWRATANNVKQDYTESGFQGEYYYYRAH